MGVVGCGCATGWLARVSQVSVVLAFVLWCVCPCFWTSCSASGARAVLCGDMFVAALARSCDRSAFLFPFSGQRAFSLSAVPRGFRLFVLAWAF